MLNTKLRTPI